MRRRRQQPVLNPGDQRGLLRLRRVNDLCCLLLNLCQSQLARVKLPTQHMQLEVFLLNQADQLEIGLTGCGEEQNPVLSELSPSDLAVPSLKLQSNQLLVLGRPCDVEVQPPLALN